MEIGEEEFKALTSCLTSFYEYGNWARRFLLAPKQARYDALSAREKACLPWFPEFLQELDNCIMINEQLLQNMAIDMGRSWGTGTDPKDWYRCTYGDFDKVRSTLKQLTREWSAEGQEERTRSYGKVIQEVEEHFSTMEGVKKHNLQILVPGCGLGRLVAEFGARGYQCQGNEISYHMLLTSNFMMNHSALSNARSIMLHPFIHRISHQISRAHYLRAVEIPDFDARFRGDEEAKIEDLLSMAAGSFIDLYGPANLATSEAYSSDAQATDFRQENDARFDFVVTCYFIDTATNIFDYLNTINHCLKHDGLWINYGPLLWHFEDEENTTTVVDENGERKDIPLKGLELTREDLHALIKHLGFEFVKYENGIDSTYAGDLYSLSQYNYECEYWVCRKTGNPSEK